MSVQQIEDFSCSMKLNLLLIAKGPLNNDKKEIFDSIPGIDYLSKCFSSKFKHLNTHITYLREDKSFSNNMFFDILAYYARNSKIDISKLVICFVGQDAYDAFAEETKTIPDNFIKGTRCLRYDDKKLRINYGSLNHGKSFYLPCFVLPSLADATEELSTTLDNIYAEHINTSTNEESPYISIPDFIERLNVLRTLYKDGHIRALRLGGKVINNKIAFLELYDDFYKTLSIFNPNDNICNLASIEDKKQAGALLKEVLCEIPIYGENCNEIVNSFGPNLKEKIKFFKKEDLDELKLDRPMFKVHGNANGTASDWYKKWKDEAFNRHIAMEISKKEADRDGYADNNKYEWIYDIEVFHSDWLFVAKSVDGLNKVVCWNDPVSLKKWIKNKILIGFNNGEYDNPVITYAMVYNDLIKTKPDALTVKGFSDKIIHNETTFFSEIDSFDVPRFLSWDISFHLPFDTRRNSLKKLTMAVLNKVNYDSNVPFDIGRPLTLEERQEVEKYCEMDVDNTLALFLPDPNDVEKKKENPKHDMRTFARESYDIRWNMIVEYKMKAKSLINKAASFAGKLLCGEDAKPNSKNTWKEVDGKKVFYSIPKLAYEELKDTELLDFYIKNQTNPDYLTEKFEYHLGGDDAGHLYQFGFGGLHQALLGYGSENLVNMDVASLYPSLLVHYGLMSRGAIKNPRSYQQVYETRLHAKKTGLKLLNEGLKLILNGAIGAMLSAYNPLYDTWSNSTICVHGQLLLFILVKRLFDAGFNIVQTNTDGIMIERQADVDFMPICEKWMEETKLILEFDEIDVLQQNNVNNYYCKFSNGKVKSKGFYLSNEKFGKATSKILCNLVTKRPLLDGLTPKDFVIYKKHAVGEIYDAKTDTKLEGRSLAFVIGYPYDQRAGSYYSRSRNAREVVVKDAKGKTVMDENGNPVTEITNSISKITGFTDHMLLVDSVNQLTMEEINTQEYINLAKNLLDKKEIFGPYYDVGYVKVNEPAYLQALNAFKDNTASHPTKSGVVCQNFLFECDYLTKEEQEELIQKIEKYTYRIVWSGNRSYHIVVRLNTPVVSTKYKEIWYYLQNRILKLTGADEQANLPNKYTRVPGQINPKTGNMQTLYSENKYEFNLAKILEDLPRLGEAKKPIYAFKGKVTLDALKRHVKRQDWSEGNRFGACQKLSPALITQVSMEELLNMIPCRLEKDHKQVIRAKYHYWEKYNSFCESSE